jgi:hypothetical protein
MPMVRRSDSELVEDIIAFLVDNKDRKRVTLGEFSETVGLNSASAKKWFEIIQFIKMVCPDFYVEEQKGQNTLIKFPYVATIGISRKLNNNNNK